jgi:hypothetical protein
VSDKERDQPDERKLAEDDAKEDLELKDETADQVRGGLIHKDTLSADRAVK